MQLVGRSVELDRLSGALERAVSGVGGVCLLRGEPGIGKSRLCQELAARAAPDIRVLWGGCWESGGAPSYWPWIQVLRGLLKQLPDGEVDALLGTRTAWLAQILPELAQRQPDFSAAPPLDPAQARFQLMDCVSGLLCDAAANAPTLLLLEDLHAADQSSVLLLDFISRASRSSRLLVLGTYRDAEVQVGPLAPVLGELSRHAETLSLQRFSEATLTELLSAQLGASPDPETADRVWRLSEGNPLFAAEVLRLLQADGSLPASAADGAWGTIRARLQHLSPNSLELLGVASVLGRDFSQQALGELIEHDARALREALREAQAAHLLEAHVGDAQRFSHGLIREAVYQDLSSTRREALHQQVAQRLEQAPTQRELASEVAHHWLHAGVAARPQARSALMAAARAAESRYAFDDAARDYQRALDLSDAGSELALEVLLALGRAQLQSGDPNASRATCDVALSAAKRRGSPEWVARATLARGGALVFGSVDGGLVSSLQAALAGLGQADSSIRAEVMARLAAAMQPARDPRVPVELAKQAINLARDIGDLGALQRVLDHGCSSMMDLIPAPEREPFNREFVSLAEASGSLVAALRGWQRLVFDAAEQGQLGRVQDAIAHAADIGERLTHPHYRWPVAALSAMVSIFQGDFSLAEDQRRDFLRLAARTQDLNARVAFALQSLELMRVSGFQSHDEWQRHTALVSPSSPLMQQFYTVLVLEGLVRAGEHTQARRQLQGVDIDFLLGCGDASVLFPLVFSLFVLEERDWAKRILEALKPRSGSFVSWGAVGMAWGPPVDLMSGWLSLLLGDSKAATAHLERALSSARACNGKAWIPSIEQALSGESSLPAPSSKALRVVEPVLGASLRLLEEGEGWRVNYGEHSYQLKATKGITLLAKLISHPGREFHCLDLVGTPRDLQAGLGVEDTHLDQTARQQYMTRGRELREELAEAEAMNDLGRKELLSAELEAIAAELKRGVGLGGRLRNTQGAAERARVNVQRRLKDAVGRISKLNPELGRHLGWAVRTGIFCSYDPN